MIEKLIDALRSALNPTNTVARVDTTQTPDGGDLLLMHKDYAVHALPTNVQDFTFEDMDSFEKFASAHVDPKSGAIFYSDDGIKAVHHIAKPWFGGADYNFKKSTRLMEWLQSGPMSPKNFRDFLQASLRAGELDPTGEQLFIAMASIKLNASIEFELVTEDQQSMGFSIKQDKAAGSTEFPKEINAVLPIFEGEDECVSIPWRLAFNQPNPDNTRCTFRLDCPILDVIVRAEVEKRITRLKAALENHPFYRGHPDFKDINKNLIG